MRSAFRFPALLVLAAMVAGCAGEPSDQSRLKPGDRAMLLDTGSGKDSEGRKLETTYLGSTSVPVGLEVKVVLDDEPDNSRLRDVVVIVDSGRFEGIGARICRYRLVPSK